MHNLHLILISCLLSKVRATTEMAPGLPFIPGSRNFTISETSPLLGKFRDEEEQDGYKAASFSSAVFSLCTSIVGAGIMSLPATMSIVGLVPGLILMLFMGYLTYVSVNFLLKYSDAGMVDTYGGVMADSFGQIGRIILQIFIVLNIFGLLVAYLIIVADVLSGTTSSSVRHSGVLEEWAGGQAWWNGRTVVMLFTTVFILVPLVSFRRVDSLRLSSTLSIALAVVFVIVTAAITLYKLAAGDIGMPRLFPQIDYDASTILNYFTVVPVWATAYICHHCVHPIFKELKKASQARGVVLTSISFCTAIYFSTSIFGYLLFGDDVLSDVLSNFDTDLGIPYSSVFSDIVRVGYTIHVILVFPVLHFSLRLNVDGLIFPTAKPLSSDNRRFFLLTAAILTLSFLGASFIPDIWDVFQLTGSTSSISLGFIFPGIIVLRNVHGIATRGEKWTACFMVVLAIVTNIIALSGDIYGFFS